MKSQGGVCISSTRSNPLTVNPSPAEPGYGLPLQTVNPNQLASEEVNWLQLIWIYSLPLSW